MKATLEFDLPEDKEEFELAVKATLLHNSITDILELFRRMDKYEDFGNIKHVWHDDECFIALIDVRIAIIGILEANSILDIV